MAGKLALEIVAVDPHDILDEVLSLLSEISNVNGIELAVYASIMIRVIFVNEFGVEETRIDGGGIFKNFMENFT